MKQKIEQKAEDILDTIIENENATLRYILTELSKEYPDLVGEIEDVIYRYVEELVNEDMRDIEIDIEVSKDAD